MRKLIWICLITIGAMPVWGQADLEGDTTIYKVAEEAPRFPVCEGLDTTIQVIQQCAQQQLLAFMYQNIQYPVEARNNGNEGTVVVSFVVEKDSTISNPTIIRDIGGGCGEETLRVVNGMNEIGVKWIPGKMKGVPVRTQLTLPIRFKLEELPPYVIVDRDTVWTEADTPLAYKGGVEALAEFLDDNLKYPESKMDSCSLGTIDVQVLVERDGNVRILNMVDYADLGFDFWYSAISATTKTYGNWEPAIFEGNKVPAAYDIGVTFIPTGDQCKSVVDTYQKAVQLNNDGLQLLQEEKTEEALAKLTEAVNLFPDDASFLLVRGQAYLDLQRFAEACADLSKAQRISLITAYDRILPVICR